MTYWEKQTKKSTPWEQPQATMQDEAPMVLNEEAFSEIQGEEYNVFEEEDEDLAETMLDANLRLEQGRLYQMFLEGDIFADTNADPRAVKNVSRQMKKHARECMEILLGMRQERPIEATVVSSPFNDLEVEALKMVASRVSNGATEKVSRPTPEVQAPPKKDGITSISGNLRVNAPVPVSGTPLRKVAKQPAQRVQQATNPSQGKTPQAKSAIKESNLTKEIKDMTPEELAAYNKAAEERSASKRAAMPQNLVPHPSPQQLEMMYTGMASNLTIANPWRASNP
jgi:hypothetical protein